MSTECKTQLETIATVVLVFIFILSLILIFTGSSLSKHKETLDEDQIKKIELREDVGIAIIFILGVVLVIIAIAGSIIELDTSIILFSSIYSLFLFTVFGLFIGVYIKKRS